MNANDIAELERAVKKLQDVEETLLTLQGSSFRFLTSGEKNSESPTVKVPINALPSPPQPIEPHHATDPTQHVALSPLIKYLRDLIVVLYQTIEKAIQEQGQANP